ncbi:DNA mismatch repair protein MutS [Sphingomonas sp. HDW15A]|uniref:Smr/MutS family protein n=1 Tax=Sphingomonas sp. HDW15A TaxID=2714942 RepID=UPI00140A2FAA|nr:Smr/MutS family protein [Sphingomonas sp. HDW15A]QIK96193.1 DNA mismatch repair protein MutS [Sphingomonas sp. HDW15A]
MRRLTDDEAQLWAKVAATIRPLSRDKVSEPPIEIGPAKNAPPPRRPADRAPEQQPAPGQPAKPSSFQQGGLDGHWDRRLRAGDVRPDRVIDLHGHNLDRAWGAIDDGLEQAISGGERVILLITGHARSGEPPVQRGKIRAAVHDWLAASRHAGRIAAVRGASKRHGGGGSLYLILRR